jgi:hypothetical protein
VQCSQSGSILLGERGSIRGREKGELFNLFGNGRFEHDFLPKLSADSLALNLWNMRSHFAEAGLSTEYIAIIQTLYHKTPPRLILTHELVLEWAKEIGIEESSEFFQLIRTVRSQTFDAGSQQQDQFDDHYELDDWVSLGGRI